MSENYEIDKETLTKIFIQIEESIINQTSSSDITINDDGNGEKIKLKKITFNNKNPYLSKVKKLRKSSISSKK